MSNEAPVPTISVAGTGSVREAPTRARLAMTFAGVGAVDDPAVQAGVVRRAQEAADWLRTLEPPVVVDSPSVQSWVGKIERRRQRSVRATLTVEIHDPAQVSLIANQALEHADETSGPWWSLADYPAAVRRARIAAVAEAKQAAQDYAAAAGVRLGLLLSISDPELNGGGPRTYARAMAAPAAGAFGGDSDQPQLDLSQPEPEEVTSRVHMVWLLED